MYSIIHFPCRAPWTTRAAKSLKRKADRIKALCAHYYEVSMPLKKDYLLGAYNLLHTH